MRCSAWHFVVEALCHDFFRFKICGSFSNFLLNIVEGVDVVALIRAYQGHSLALVPHGVRVRRLYDVDMSGPVAILIGNEGAGLTQALIDAATHRVTIPMPGKIESLNAAAAGAICLFELVRQRGAVTPLVSR